MEKITLRQIAEKLGISIGTVDRAIHNRPDINPDTRKKVLDLIKEYDYRPDKVARSLSLRTKKVNIGVILQKTPVFFWDNVKNGVKAAENSLSDFGLRIRYKEIEHGREHNEILKKMDELIYDRVDAIAIVPLNSPQVKEKIQKAIDMGIHVATLNDDITDSKRVFYVGPQMKQSGRVAGELMGNFLRGKGNVFIINGGLSSLEYSERYYGFMEVLEKSFPGINIAGSYTCNMNNIDIMGRTVIDSIIKHSDEIDGIYNIDGATLFEIGQIIKSSTASKKPILMGHETWSGVKDLIEEGIITATISQDPYSQGYYVVKLLYDYIMDGISPEFEKMYTRIDIVMKENMNMSRNIINPYYV